MATSQTRDNPIAAVCVAPLSREADGAAAAAAAEPPSCRICLSGDDPDDLFAPCDCRGTTEFVHRTCLRQWVAVSHKRSCTICNAPYTFAPAPAPPPNSAVAAAAAAYHLLANARVSRWHDGGRRFVRAEAQCALAIFLCAQAWAILMALLLLHSLSPGAVVWLRDNLYPYYGTGAAAGIVVYCALCDAAILVVAAYLLATILAPPSLPRISRAICPIWREHACHGLHHARPAVAMLAVSLLFSAFGVYYVQLAVIMCTARLTFVANERRKGTMRVWARERLAEDEAEVMGRTLGEVVVDVPSAPSGDGDGASTSIC